MCDESAPDLGTQLTLEKNTASVWLHSGCSVLDAQWWWIGGASSEKKEFSSCSGASGRAVGESCRGSGIVGLSVSSTFSQENLPPSLFKPLARSIALWFLHRFVFLCCVLARAVRNFWRFLMWLHIWEPTLTYQGFYELV